MHQLHYQIMHQPSKERWIKSCCIFLNTWLKIGLFKNIYQKFYKISFESLILGQSS
jgi:hypothetical protein